MKEEIKKILKASFDENKLKYDDITISESNRPDLCDYQCNDLFKISKQNNKNIEDLAHDIIENLNKNDKYTYYFKNIEFARPGFLNITIGNEFINDNIRKMIDDDKLCVEAPTKKESFIIDFGGANVAKPLHVGHMRTIVVGEAIRRIIEFKGHNIISDVHLGDYGLQIGEVIYGAIKENKKIEDIDIEYLDYIYPKMSEIVKGDEEIKEKCAQITKELQEGNEEYKSYWKKIMEVSIKEIKKSYDFLGAHFNYWYGESDAYKYLDEVEEILNSKNLLKVSENALVVDLKEEKDNKEMPPLIFKKSNGAYLYESTEIGTILQRKKDFNPDHILYVVDNRQSLHFERCFRASEKAGILNEDHLEFLGYGTVNGEDGKPYKTRDGKTPKLTALFNNVKEIFISKKESNKNMSEKDLDIIVNSILKFADLQNNRAKDYIFDINKFADVVGKTGPYILYTYLRMSKIIESKNIVASLSNNIYNDYDRNLRNKLLKAKNAIDKAFETRMPSYIAEYVYDLCVLANTFYENNHINSLEDKENSNDWLIIVKLTNKVIKTMLDLLAIDLPSAM